MNQQKLCLLLQNTILFRDIAEAACGEVVAAGRLVTLTKGETLFHQGDEAQVFYIVVTGHVKLIQLNPEGHQVTINYVSQGGGIGIIVALSDTVYPVTAEVVQGGEAITWSRAIIRELMLRHPQLALNGLNIMAGYFVNLQHRFHELAAERVERRVARALLRLVRQAGRKGKEGIEIDMPLSRQDLAEMTGTTLFTVSRILSQWEQQGYVLAGREKVTIQKPHQLVIIAEDLPAGSSGASF